MRFTKFAFKFGVEKLITSGVGLYQNKVPREFSQEGGEIRTE